MAARSRQWEPFCDLDQRFQCSLHDLQSAITTTFSTPLGGTPHDTGQTMAFFNMQKGDVPLFKSLADQYTISDNYHQPVMGGHSSSTTGISVRSRSAAVTTCLIRLSTIILMSRSTCQPSVICSTCLTSAMSSKTGNRSA